MNTLDLKGFGVQELNAKEMEVIDGGIWNVVVGAVGLIWFGVEVYNNREAVMQDVKQGINDIF